MKPDQGSLNIYLVIVELTNCAEFARVFYELGVNHVISFNYQGLNERSQLIDDEDVDSQLRLNLIQSFMKEFSYSLYPMFFKDWTIVEAISYAFKNAAFTSQIGQFIKFEVDHMK